MLSAFSKRRVAPYGAADVPGKTGARRAWEYDSEEQYEQEGGKTHPPRCRVVRLLRRILSRLFCCFSGGDVPPTSPRRPAPADFSFMPGGLTRNRHVPPPVTD